MQIDEAVFCTLFAGILQVICRLFAGSLLFSTHKTVSNPYYGLLSHVYYTSALKKKHDTNGGREGGTEGRMDGRI